MNTPYDKGNPFAMIIRGEIPSYQVYSDGKVLAFLDINPINPGHILVVPRVPVSNASELDDEMAGYMFQIGLRLSRALRKTDIPCQGVNFFLSDGVSAGQEVFHVHLHVVPRTEGDGFGLRFGPNNRKSLPPFEMAALAEKIRSCLPENEEARQG